MSSYDSTRMATIEADLSTPTVEQRYPLGFELVNEEYGTSGSKALKKYVYVKAGAALTATKAYFIANLATAGSQVTTATPATSALGRRVGIAPVSFTNAYYGFLQIEGEAIADGAGACTAGNTVKLTNGAVTVTDEAGAAETALTVGFVKTTTGGAGAVNVYLINKRVTV